MKKAKDDSSRKRKGDIREWLQPKPKQEKSSTALVADDEPEDVVSSGTSSSYPTASCSTSTETLTSAVETSASTSYLTTTETPTSVMETPAGHTTDIGHAVNNRTKLSREDVYKFLNSVWTPEETYKFPVVQEGNRKRKFQWQWLKDFQWLAYSEQRSGAFCKLCVLFAGDTAGMGGFQDLKTFVKEPLQKFKKGKEAIQHHMTTKYHNFSALKAAEFLKNYEAGEKTSVIVRLDQRKQVMIEQNRRRLVPIFKTVLFCAQNNLPLRGHRDDGALDSEEKLASSISGHEGIFRALLSFRVDAGDEDLKEHLHSSSKNCTMISKTIQNEIICTLGEVLRSKIISKIKDAKFFSILADETTDISMTEQMTMCIRYVDKLEVEAKLQYILREDFIGFIDVADTTGKNLKNVLVQELENAGLSLSNLRGQGYDGGSNMSGSANGVQSLILKDQPLAFYTHCFSHSLSLCVAKACNVAAIRNMVGTVTSISWFLNGSAKRVSLLREIISGADIEDHKKKKLKGLCETRWVERHECFQTFDDLLEYVVECLERLGHELRDAEMSSKAIAFSAAVKRSEFLIALKVVNKLNSFTLVLSRYLQTPTLEMSSAIKHVDNIIEVFNDFRNSDTAFPEIYGQAEEAASTLDVELKKPRVCGRQTSRANVDSNSTMDYYRLTIYYPFLDHYLQALNDRFKGKFLEVIPLEGLICKNVKKLTDLDLENVVNAAKIYSEDLNFPTDLELRSTILLWRNHWKNEVTNVPETAIQSMAHCTLFPNIKILLNLLAVIPVTSAEPERTFSALKRLKTYLRGTMTQSRLNGLALPLIHKEIPVDIGECVQKFSQSKPRRMEIGDWASA